MIRVMAKRKEDGMTGFHIEGHSGYARQGSDIVCSAISALAINCVNSIEEFTQDEFSVGTDEGRGMIDFEIMTDPSPESRLLLRSMMLGIRGIQKTYGSQYVAIINH